VAWLLLLLLRAWGQLLLVLVLLLCAWGRLLLLLLLLGPECLPLPLPLLKQLL
jgi:hypothetical protein